MQMKEELRLLCYIIDNVPIPDINDMHKRLRE